MSDEFLLEQFPARQEKEAVVVIGRFNPPTCGHAKVIETAKKEYVKHKYDAVFVVVVEGKHTSQDKKKNPLTAQSRIKYLTHTRFAKGIKFLVADNAYDALIAVRNAGYEPIVVVGGASDEENRADSYQNILDKYFKNPDGTQIGHRAITVKRNPDSDGVAGISGSIVRAAAAAGRYEDFKDWTCLDSESLTRSMYNEIRKEMGIESTGDK